MNDPRLFWNFQADGWSPVEFPAKQVQEINVQKPDDCLFYVPPQAGEDIYRFCRSLLFGKLYDNIYEHREVHGMNILTTLSDSSHLIYIRFFLSCWWTGEVVACFPKEYPVAICEYFQDHFSAVKDSTVSKPCLSGPHPSIIKYSLPKTRHLWYSVSHSVSHKK